jgi:hypothetical protein
VFRFDNVLGQFLLFQQLATNGAVVWEHFLIGDTNFLAVANYNNDITYNIKSNIYRFDTGIGQFVMHQQLDPSGAYRMKYFVFHK